MGKVKRGEVQYKETEVFELFPTLEYDKAQKQRLILFHAYNRNIRRIINYAAHFDAPNRICMVYVVGEVAPEKIQKALAAAECSERVCVLTSPFPADELAFWRDFDERRSALKTQGNWDEERQNVTEEWLHNRDVEIWWQGELDAAAPDLDGQICIDAPAIAVPDVWRTSNAKLVAQNAETLDMIRRYHALERKAPSYFRRWTLHRRGREPTPFCHAETGKLIAKIYPYGAEARGVNAYAGLSPASAKAAVNLIMDGEENKRLGFTRDEIMKSAAPRKIRRYVRDAIAANGYCNLFEFKDFIQSPPFGLDNNGYSAAILSAALAEEDGLIYRDSVSDSDVRRNMYGLFQMLFQVGRYSAIERVRKRCSIDRRCYLPCLYREFECHRVVRRALAGLYGVPDEWEGNGLIVRCRERIEELFRLPLSMSDDLLFYLTGPEICWYDRAEMERLASEVTARRDELPRVLAAHIAKDKRIPYRERLPGAACWLWDRETALDSPHCMMSDEERKRFRGYYERRSDLEKRKSAAKAVGDMQAYWDADKQEILESRAEMAYLQDRAEPCRRRLLALCGKSP